MVRDTWAMGLRAAIQLCDSCIGRWLRMRPPGDEDEREDDTSAFAAAMAGSRAVDRAWTGMAVREAMMLEPQVPRKEVVRNDARRFGRHCRIPGLRRMGPDIEVVARWREWLERGLAGYEPPLARLRERVQQAVRTRMSPRLKRGMGPGEGTKIVVVDPSMSAGPSLPTTQESRRERRRRMRRRQRGRQRRRRRARA